MQTVVVTVTVEYRGDGKVSKGDVQGRVAEAILAAQPGELFQLTGGATYAGYSVALPPKAKKPSSGV